MVVPVVVKTSSVNVPAGLALLPTGTEPAYAVDDAAAIAKAISDFTGNFISLNLHYG
jgi:hypothetical protein